MDNNTQNNPVKFDEEVVLTDRASQISRQSALTGFVIKLGLAKSESQASYILIGTIVLCLLATVFVISQYLL